MIVQYHGHGAKGPEMLDLEYRVLAKEHFSVQRGASTWLPDDYLHHDPETGTDLFAEMGIRVLEPPIPLQPKAFAHAKDGDSLLVRRQYGGFGDILMQTMIWPNLRRQFPTSRLTYAVPIQFHALLEGNPSLDEVTNLHLASRKRFDFTGDISTICGFMENAIRPCVTHRADIWGEHLGVVMDTHEGHYWVAPHERAWAEQYVTSLRPRPLIGIAPYSADKRKDLPDEITQAVIDRLACEVGAEVCVLHGQPTSFRRAHNCNDLTFRWLGALLTQMDAVMSVDTGTMHMAAIMKRPTLAIFGSEDGRVFTKYYSTVRLLQTFQRECQPCWYQVPCLNGDSKRRPGDCLADLTADQIVAAIVTLLEASRGD